MTWPPKRTVSEEVAGKLANVASKVIEDKGLLLARIAELKSRLAKYEQPEHQTSLQSLSGGSTPRPARALSTT